MARKTDIRYIRYYTDGSAARQIEPKPEKKKKPQHPTRPRQRKQKQIILHVDPLPVIGIILAGVMFIMLVVGAVQLLDAREQARAMDSYVQQLALENERLTAEYKSGYDLSAVGEMALAIGMVPVEQIEQVPITITVPEPEPEMTVWEQVLDFLTGLFA